MSLLSQHPSIPSPAAALVLSLFLTSCGSENSAGDNGAEVSSQQGSAQPLPRLRLPPYPYVKGLKFPTSGPNPGTMNVVRAFSNLSFSRPLFLTYPPDGTNRIFVVEQGSSFSGANIWVFPNNDSVATSQRSLFLNLSVTAGGEQGLLGLAFDPDYKKNGYFYVYYTGPGSPRRSVVSRFSVSRTDPNKADPKSEKILLTQSQPYSNHNGGMLAFGPDNMLYIGFGDGGSGGDPRGNGQNLGTLLGSICRIDPHGKTGSLSYGIPHDNPFVNQTGARGEIWAFGLRNPWRFSFDRNTGEMWCGDVGQNAREEVDLIVKGGNYGWNWFEGNNVYRSGAPGNLGDIKPVWDYNRTTGRSITGGYVYRGSRNPSLRGAYLVADYVTRSIWALARSGSKVNVTRIGSVSSPSSFGEDRDGEVYVVSLSGGIYRFTERTTPTDPPFPLKLSETGLFVDTKALVPDPALLPYEIHEPAWTDGAHVQRWIAMPQPQGSGSRITFHPTGTWQFPTGTVLVQHFELETTVGVPSTAVRLETRVLVKEVPGWAGYVYRWDNQGTEAYLLPGRDTRDLTITDPSAPGGRRTQTWVFPGRANCFECHLGGWEVLGARTLQTNKRVRYRAPLLAANQLDLWNQLGMFAGNIGPATNQGAYLWSRNLANSLDDRARTYLAVNCAMCHRPQGPGGGGVDLRYATALGKTGLVNQKPTHGSLGIPNAVLIKPGSKEQSVLWERLRRTDSSRMPVGSHLVDQEGLQLIGEWIDQMQ